MLQFIKYIIPALLFMSCQSGHSQSLASHLDSLYLNHNFFALEDIYKAKKDSLSASHQLYYEAILDNAFNRPQASNQKINSLLKKKNNLLSQVEWRNTYQTKLSNHTNLHEYADAYKTTALIVPYYDKKRDRDMLNEIYNSAAIWRTLQNTPAQKTHKQKDYAIQLTRDKVGLMNVAADINDTTINMIFDTGANFSVLQRSVAKKLGLDIISSGAYVNSSTGARVRSDIAVANKINLGGLIVENVVFLITNDEDLSFPQIKYAINGIIGYPVIRSFEQFQIDKKDKLFIPQHPKEYAYNNFALDNLTPIVKAVHNNKNLVFHFDTGATHTDLYRLFYDENRDEVEANFRMRTFSSGGAGGISTGKAYQVNDFKLQIGDAVASLNKVRLSTNDVKQGDEYYHGNLGQDYIRKFDKMIISFKHSSIVFE